MTIPRPQIVTLLLVSGALLALPAVSQAECPNEQLRAENNSTNLPDCRAYEQVSPSEKDEGSGGVLSFDSPNQVIGSRPLESLADGSAITYPGEPFATQFKGRREFEQFIQYTSFRSSTGWGLPQTSDTLSLEEVPAPVLPALAPSPPAQVLEETPDGAKVFFLDEAELIAGVSNAAAGEPDLYEYNVPHKELTDLTVDKTGHADVRGILGIGGEEGSYVYFVAGGTLAPGASTGGCGTDTEMGATGTGCNLYLRHDGTTTFIATLPSQDEQGVDGVSSDVLDWPLSPSNRTAEVSPSGRYVAFGNVAAIGQYVGESEILRYDAGDAEKGEQSIICVSCSPSDAAVSGGTLIPFSTRASINGANRQRYMLDDGRVFFSTTATLVSRDVNRQVDVYEWEAGKPHLVSGGTSETSETLFADASANGSDVFFTTNQPLLPEDQDEITDLYDAREDGGVPPPPEPPCAVNAACPGTLPTPPSSTVPPTFTIPGSSWAQITTLGSGAKPKRPTRAEELSKALRVCRKAHSHSKKLRSSCERKAHKTYGPSKKR